MTSSDVRERLIDALRHLIGPEPGGEHADEVLPIPPSRWYLTGFLVPFEGGESQRAARAMATRTPRAPAPSRS